MALLKERRLVYIPTKIQTHLSTNRRRARPSTADIGHHIVAITLCPGREKAVSSPRPRRSNVVFVVVDCDEDISTQLSFSSNRTTCGVLAPRSMSAAVEDPPFLPHLGQNLITHALRCAATLFPPLVRYGRSGETHSELRRGAPSDEPGPHWTLAVAAGFSPPEPRTTSCISSYCNARGSMMRLL